ncbi:hypothetical protein CMV_018048, partial [Castanea mollissima]
MKCMLPEPSLMLVSRGLLRALLFFLAANETPSPTKEAQEGQEKKGLKGPQTHASANLTKGLVAR